MRVSIAVVRPWRRFRELAFSHHAENRCTSVSSGASSRSCAVTAPTVKELDTAVAPIEQAAIQASCETRLLVGQQAAAFTAAALTLASRI